MALADAVQGAKRPSQEITWTDASGAPVDLTGATITARIDNRRGTLRSADGSFTVVTPAAGLFRWDYGTADVGTEGKFWVQFSASFASGPTPERNVRAEWRVHPAI